MTTLGSSNVLLVLTGVVSYFEGVYYLVRPSIFILQVASASYI